MIVKYYFFILLVLPCMISFAQNDHDIARADKHQFEQQSFPTFTSSWLFKNEMSQGETIFYPEKIFSDKSTGFDYDVKYHRLELRINPDTAIGKYIRGKVTTYFTTLNPSFSLIKFDFATALICDSVYYHGAKLGAGSKLENADTLEIMLPVIATAGTLDSVSVYYKGIPPTVAGFSGGTGFVKSTHGSPAKNYIYTLSEPYSSYTWWPCKSFVTNDKADSLDLVVSTPTGFKTAGNGTLVSETTVGASVVTYWKHRYPIAAYQVCIAVANYTVYPAMPTMVTIGSTTMPYYNYLFPETDNATSRATLDKTVLMLTTFSNKFGDYPFKNEKYGHYTFGFGGGMEHNTFSGMHPGTYNSSTAWDIIAHELGHQWFGANVTCGSWSDIWLNESFATYSEIVCAEFAPSVSAAAGQTGLSWRQYIKSSAINTGSQSQSIHVTDTSGIVSIFTPAVYVYERGGMVISMLRTLLGDVKFFQAIKNYESDPLLQYSSALTADIKRNMEAVSGLDLSTFFNQWIYNTGFANYNAAKWNNAGQQLTLQLPQTTQLSGLSHFDMPVAVRIQGSIASQDTTVIIYDENGILQYVNNGVLTSTGASLIQYNLSFVPQTITFDAYSQVLANGSFTKDPALSVLRTSVLMLDGKKDNDAVKLWWNIDNSFDYAAFEVEKSIEGKAYKKIETIYQQDAPGMTSFLITDKDIAAGVSYYRIKIIQKDGRFSYSKIVPVAGTDQSSDYSISPNPVLDHIFIETGKAGHTINIRINDAAGKLIKKTDKRFITKTTPIRLSLIGVKPGNYFVVIEDNNASTYTKQIVVVK